MEHHTVDVAVVGAGGAGVVAAVTALAAGASVLLLCRETVGSGDTRLSDGRVAYPGRLPGDSPAAMAAEMRAAGDGLGRPDLIEAFCADAWRALHTYEAMGVRFARDAAGQISPAAALRRGGHRLARTFQVPGEGVSIGSALRNWVARAGVPAREGVLVLDILLDGGEVQGLIGLRLADGAPVLVACRAVILAAGTAGWLYYPHTDCASENTGAGYALALAAGAPLVEMEQVQFLPFGVASPRSMMGLIIGEGAVAGPYGRLLDAGGNVVLEGVQGMTRAQIARAMAVAACAGRTGPDGCLYLDLRPNLAHPEGRRHLETLGRSGAAAIVQRAYGREAAAGKVPWPVLPTAHYHMGGVLIDADGATAVPGLYAAGSCAGGLHGGNRLGSLGLPEAVVFGQRAGRHAARYAAGRARPLPGAAGRAACDRVEAAFGRRGDIKPVELIRHLQAVMWQHAGLARTAAGLTAAGAELARIAAASAHVATPAFRCWNTDVRDLADLWHLLPAARAILTAALARAESRGAHLRLDCPEAAPAARHTLVRRQGEGLLDLAAEQEPVPGAGGAAPLEGGVSGG